MTKEEFVKIAQRCGYGTKKIAKKYIEQNPKKSAKKYVEKNPKEEYDTNDLITLYEGSMHWEGVNGDKGLRYAYDVNGKTTAYSNGICGNSGARQDWEA